MLFQTSFLIFIFSYNLDNANKGCQRFSTPSREELKKTFPTPEEAKGVLQIVNFHRHPLMTLPLILQFQR